MTDKPGKPQRSDEAKSKCCGADVRWYSIHRDIGKPGRYCMECHRPCAIKGDNDAK